LRKYVASKNNIDKVKGLVGLIISYVCEKQSVSEISLAQKIKAHIEGDFVSVFKNSDLSGIFNYSSSYLVKIYKNEFKITPKHYAEQLVLRESVILLCAGMPVNEISARLEFSSPENFSRFFKSYYGCAPSVYREKYKHFPT
jgi:two-component system response regulator YesN